MTLKRKLLSLRHVLRLLPELLSHLGTLESLLPKLVALEPILDKIGGLDNRVSELAILEATVPRLQSLDEALAKIERLGQIRQIETVVVQSNGNGHNHDLDRLKVLSKFAQLTGKAKEIETEWQKIQQDEHDAHFSYQVFRGRNEVEYAYKKGIVDGIKWCVDRFS